MQSYIHLQKIKLYERSVRVGNSETDYEEKADWKRFQEMRFKFWFESTEKFSD